MSKSSTLSRWQHRANLDIIELNDSENSLLVDLPKPPPDGYVRKPKVVWIVEWLPSNDQPTGQQLHEWISEYGKLDSRYFTCKTKKEVITTIERATLFLKDKVSFPMPMLHIEAHGNEDYHEGPDGHGSSEKLYWRELNSPLQDLNVLTRCNLIIFIAACIGFAGINVFFQGPLAPAVALVGPVVPISSSDLLNATKEFYRGWKEEDLGLNEIAESATREAGRVLIELEPFVNFAYEAFVEQVIVSRRSDSKREQIERLQRRMSIETPLSQQEIERRLSRDNLIPPEIYRPFCQGIWNTMFMIDLFPENKKRFGVDWFKILDMVENQLDIHTVLSR